MSLHLRRLFMALCCVLILPVQAAPQAEPIVHMLDYMAVDYAGAVADGKIADEGEYTEMRDFAAQVITQLKTLEARPQQAALLADAQKLAEAVDAKAPAAQVAQQAIALRRGLVSAYNLVVAPKRAPDLSTVATQYTTLCVSCHGITGHGDGVAAPGMDPAPSNFHDAERMHQRSIYGLYNTITLGVNGTGMAAFSSLSEEQRWALAFYVANLGADPAQVKAGEAHWQQGRGKEIFSGLREVATLDANEARTRGGADMAAVYAYLVANPQAAQSAQGSPIALSKQLLTQSVDAYTRGERDLAQRLAVSSYLEGFELVEAGLDTLDADLRIRVENTMIGLRTSMREGADSAAVQKQAEEIQSLLDQTETLLSGDGLSPGAAALSSFVILLREGLEAILVLAAVIAFLVKADRRDALRYVHAGWIGALALGIFTWFAASYLISISGARRELTEGITALVAAAVLLYVGFWMHSKAYAQAWQRYVREKLTGALSTGTIGALAGLSFLAVYREVFEVVLFYQALWTQAGPGGGAAVIGGFVVGAVVLAILSWAIFRYGVRLPLGLFFGISSALMAVLAVVFVGKGVAALQEAGHIAVDLVDFPRIALLGVYPTSQGLITQAVLILVIIAGFAWGYKDAKRGAAAP